jgi:hypothetical protein
LKGIIFSNSEEEICLGSGKGAAMVACVAERCSLTKSVLRDEESADYEKVN